MIGLETVHMMQSEGVNCYVIKGSEGDVLIDTGTLGSRAFIEAWLRNYDIRLIILTHGHPGQVQNAGYFSELYGAPVMISPYDMRIARDNSSRPYFDTSAMAGFSHDKPVFAQRVNTDTFDPKIYAEEGMSLEPYGIDGVILCLEGHTKGSVGVYCKSSEGYDLYAGDAFSDSLTNFPLTCESPKKARETLEKIVSLAPDRVLCGSGRPVPMGSKVYRRLFSGAAYEH